MPDPAASAPAPAASGWAAGLDALQDGKWATFFQWLAGQVGLSAALLAVALVAGLWLGWREWSWRWQAWRTQLSTDKETLDPALLARLERASAPPGLDAALAGVEGNLQRWYGPRPWGAQAFETAVSLAVIYPLLVMLLGWLLGGDGRIGTAVVLDAGVPAWKRALLIAAMVVAFGMGLVLRLDLLVNWFSRRLAPWDKRLNGHRELLAWVMMMAVICGLAVACGAAATFAAGKAGLAMTTAALFTGVAQSVVLIASAVFLPLLFLERSLSAVALALAGAIGFGVLLVVLDLMCCNSPHRARAWAWRASWVLLLALLLVAAALFPQWAPILVASKTVEPFAANSGAFLTAFFLALLPAWNALCDFGSVALTRTILRHYLSTLQGKGTPPPWLWPLCLAADVTVALALTLLLLASVFVLAAHLQRWGWRVDAASLLRQYESSPWWSGNSFWLVSMAFTNLLPTLAHLVALAVAKVTQRFSRGQRELPGWLARLKAGQRLASTEAERLLWYLFGARLAWGLGFAVLLGGLAYLFTAWLLAQWVPALARLAMG